MKFKTVNPATGKAIRNWTTMPDARVKAKVIESRKAFLEWSNLPVKERASKIKAVAGVLRKRKKELAGLMTKEMGKPVTEALAEVEKCAWTCDVFANNAEKWLADEIVPADGKSHKVAFEPLGVILSVMPWNFPFWQALRFGIPALTAGNTTVLRHSNVVPECALAIESVFREAGLKGCFNSVITDHAQVEKIIAMPEIAAVSITGSTEAGRKVYETTAKHLKKCVLELGGSDPFIVLEDADLESACRSAVKGRNQNSGQSCIAAKRFIVVKSRAKEFAEHFTALTQKLVVGDPSREETQVGPVADEHQLKVLDGQVRDALKKGATALCGSKKFKGKGYYYESTILTDLKPSMRVWTEEVFGPVALLFSVKDEEEAIRLANSSEYGLGASVWTKDLAKGERVARRLEAGCVFVNSIVKSDPRMPFGGLKKSGIGRELSHYGLKEFTNVKSLNLYQ